MEFVSGTPAVVRSIKQRVLLNAWLRALRKARTLPSLADFRADGLADEVPDLMRLSVEGDGEKARFRITQEGSRLALIHGGAHIDPIRRAPRYLDDAIGGERYARDLPCYLECLVRRRPTYSVSHELDGRGREISFERLLLPFGASGGVEQIIGSCKSISIEGRYRLNSLMGLDACSASNRPLHAVIDREFAPRAERDHVLTVLEPS